MRGVDRGDTKQIETETSTTTHHTARKAARHERKTDEREQPRPPHRTRVAEVLVPLHAVLVDEVHDEQADEGENARDPVDEADMHWGLAAVGRVRVLGENASVEERPVRESKL